MMIFCDDILINKYSDIILKLKKNNIECQGIEAVSKKELSKADNIFIFGIDKCFLSSKTLNFLQTIDYDINIILISSHFENTEAIITYFRVLGAYNNINFNVLAEFDPQDKESLLRYLNNSSKETNELKNKKVIMYTDGACSGNPGAGGWATIMLAGGKEKRISGGEAITTNNRMELLAVIRGLESLKKECEVEIYSDSAYVVNAFELRWLENWKANGWKNSSKELVKNVDLWQILDVLVQKHKVHFFKVKGHADDYYNNLCDKMAVEESLKFQ